MSYIINVFDKDKWRIDFKGSPYMPDDNTTAKTLKEWGVINNTTLAYNLAFFDMATTKNIKNKTAYRTLEYVRNGSTIYGYGGTIEHLTIDNSECAGWKIAVFNNKLIANNTSTKRTRNMNGILVDGRYIHCQSTNKITEKAFASYILNYINKKYKSTIKILFIQDAGGSTGEYSTSSKILTAGEKEGYNGRAIPSVVLATYKGEPIKRTLKYGCKGEEVKILQMHLGGLEVDGVFGYNTRKKVIQCQKNHKLYADGIVGINTLKAMNLWEV